MLFKKWQQRHDTALTAQTSASSPATSMGQNQVKASAKTPVASVKGHRLSHNPLQGFNYNSKWTPSPSPSPPPLQIKQHRPNAARESGEPHIVSGARSGADIGKAPEHAKRVRANRGTKRSISRQAKGKNVKRRVSASPLQSRAASAADSHTSTHAGMPPEELAIERLPSPYSPEVPQGGHCLANNAVGVEMPSLAQSMTVAAAHLSLSAGGNHLRFALAPGLQPSEAASPSARDSVMSSYPLATSVSARSPGNRPLDKLRASSISSDASLAVDVSSKPLEILQLSMRATALQSSQFASPSLVSELFATVEQDSDVDPSKGRASSKKSASSRKSSPPPLLPAQHFTPLVEGFALDEELVDESPQQSQPLFVSSSLSPKAARRPLPVAPSAKTPAAEIADAFSTWQSYSEEEKLAMSRSSSMAPPVAAVAPKAEAQSATFPPYKIEQESLPPVKPLRFRPTTAAAKPAVDENKKKPDKGKRRAKSFSKTRPADTKRRALRPSPKKAQESRQAPVFSSSSSSAAGEPEMQHVESPAREHGRGKALTGVQGKARLAAEVRQDGRLGSESKKGFSNGEIAQWLQRTAVGEPTDAEPV